MNPSYSPYPIEPPSSYPSIHAPVYVDFSLPSHVVAHDDVDHAQRPVAPCYHNNDNNRTYQHTGYERWGQEEEEEEEYGVSERLFELHRNRVKEDVRRSYVPLSLHHTHTHMYVCMQPSTMIVFFVVCLETLHLDS